MRNRSTRDTGRKTSRIGATARVRTAEQGFLIVLYLKVICDPIAPFALTEEHFTIWVLEVEMLHTIKSSVVDKQCHSSAVQKKTRKA